MTFRAQGKIHFHFHYYVWIYHFDNFSHILPNSPSSVLAVSNISMLFITPSAFFLQINLIIISLGSDVMLDFLTPDNEQIYESYK